MEGRDLDKARDFTPELNAEGKTTELLSYYKILYIDVIELPYYRIIELLLNNT